MASPAWLLLIFAFSAQALISSGDGLNLLENLHHEMDDYISGLKILELNARKTLEQVYQQEESLMLKKHQENTLKLFRLANEKKCQTPTLHSINAESIKLMSNRFDKCMLLTEKLVNYENLTVNIYDEYTILRPIFCDASNNVSLCLHANQSALMKLTCTYEGIEGSVDKMDALKAQVVNLVNYLQSLINETIDDFRGCFGFIEKTFLTTQRQLIDMSC